MTVVARRPESNSATLSFSAIRLLTSVSQSVVISAVFDAASESAVPLTPGKMGKNGDQIQRLFDGGPADGTFGAMALDLAAHLFVVTAFGGGDETYFICLPGEGLSIAALAAADTTQNEDDGTAFRTHATLLLSERLTALKRERGMICRQPLRGSSGKRGVDMLFNFPSEVE